MSKAASVSSTAAAHDADKWVRGLVIAVLASILALAAMFAYQKHQFEQARQVTYVDLNIQSGAGSGMNILADFILVVPQSEKPAIESRKALLHAHFSALLGEVLGTPEGQRDVRMLPERLHERANQVLPKGLEIREILVKRLLYSQ